MMEALIGVVLLCAGTVVFIRRKKMAINITSSYIEDKPAATENDRTSYKQLIGVQIMMVYLFLLVAGLYNLLKYLFEHYKLA